MIKTKLDYTLTKTHAIKYKVYFIALIPIFGSILFKKAINKMTIEQFDHIMKQLSINYNVIK